MKPLIDLNQRDCRWPVKYTDQHYFCAKPQTVACPYCAEHAKMAYVPARGPTKRPYTLSLFGTRGAKDGVPASE
jgi:hypothetical protein